MAIIPSGKKMEKSCEWENYVDEAGTFTISERTLVEVIEAVVTNGRGYVNLNGKGLTAIPYAENDLKDKINPKIYCFTRLESDKFPNFEQDIKEGHPEHSKTYFESIFLE